MNINNYINKRLTIFFITLLFIAIAFIGSSYAFKNKNANIINNSKLDVKYDIDNSNIMPMDKNDGLNIKGSNITITNNDSYDINYTISINRTDPNSLSFDKLYYSIDGINVNNFYDSANNIIYEDTIKVNETKVINIKIWPNSELISNSSNNYINLDYIINEK